MNVRILLACLATVTLSCHREPQRAAHAPPADIILVTIDTLRADALGFMGRRDVETPFLDRIAAESVVFTNAHAHNVVTLPSHANILTGLYPYQHGIRDNAGFKLDPGIDTIASLLKAKGYATAAFVAAFPLDARYGLTRGFDVYDDKYPEGKGTLDFIVAERPAEEVLTGATAWWNAQSSPRFLWVHLYEPHAPYAPPAPFAERYAGKEYLGEVAHVDAALSRFIGPLLRPETMLIVTSDHGEALGDHGELTHGLFAYEATLRVPLLVRDATARPRRDDSPARHIDILPTIAARAGAAVPDDRPGRSLLTASEAGGSTYFEALSASLNRGWAPLVGLIDEGHKYIDLPVAELYDLRADPAESRNVLSEKRRVTAQIRKSLAASAPKSSSARRSIDPDEAAQLLSLGYIAGSAAKKSYTAADDPKNLIEFDTALHRAVDHYQRGKTSEALAEMERLVGRRPDMASAREMYAFMLQQAEQPAAAISVLRGAIEHGHAPETTKVRLGLLLSETGRAEEAVEILAPFADRNDVEVLNAYGIALADVGRGREAAAQFERVLAVDPTNATAYQNLGIVALRSGNASDAERLLHQALSIDRDMPIALNTLGVVYARSGRADQAIDAWRRAVAIDPRLYDALFNLALVSGQNERWTIARDALRQFIRTAPPERYARELTTAKRMLAEVERRHS